MSERRGFAEHPQHARPPPAPCCRAGLGHHVARQQGLAGLHVADLVGGAAHLHFHADAVCNLALCHRTGSAQAAGHAGSDQHGGAAHGGVHHTLTTGSAVGACRPFRRAGLYQRAVGADWGRRDARRDVVAAQDSRARHRHPGSGCHLQSLYLRLERSGRHRRQCRPAAGGDAVGGKHRPQPRSHLAFDAFPARALAGAGSRCAADAGRLWHRRCAGRELERPSGSAVVVCGHSRHGARLLGGGG